MQECIDSYLQLSKEVFKIDQVLFNTFPLGDDQCRFDYTRLENAIQDVVQKCLGSPDFVMSASTNKPSCPTFVVAKLAEDVDGPPQIFRSYYIPGYGPASKCPIWQAARATTAAPTFFKAMEITNPSPAISFVDGGVGYNNPSKLAQQEAKHLWPEIKSSCLVSIGTGRQSSVDMVNPSILANDIETQRNFFGRLKDFVPGILDLVPGWKSVRDFPPGVVAVMQMANALSALVGNSENVHREIQTTADTANVDAQFPYFRFNVQREVGDIGLGDFTKSRKITALTAGYMGDPSVVQRKMRCVRWLITAHTFTRK